MKRLQLRRTGNFIGEFFYGAGVGLGFLHEMSLIIQLFSDVKDSIPEILNIN